MESTSLKDGTPQGLMAFWSDIAIESQPLYQRWHNNEHIPERLSIPGFVRGRRYRSVTNDLRFLMYYDTENLEVLTSAAYLKRLNEPTSRTTAALKHFSNGNRTAYQLHEAYGTHERKAPPIVAIVQFAPPNGTPQVSAEAQSKKLVSMQRLSEAVAIERVLEYRIHNAGTTITTNEASVHKAETSEVGGLLVLHSDNIALLDDANAWETLNIEIAQWALENLISEVPLAEVYSLEFSLENDAYLNVKGLS